MTPEFWYLAIGGLLVYGLLFWIDRRWGRELLNKNFNERERAMAASIMKSEQAYVRMESTIDVLTEQIEIKDDQIAAMRVSSAERDAKIADGDIKIAELTREIQRLEMIVADLTRQLQEKHVIEKPPQPMKVLAIWSTVPGQVPLDVAGESDALYNAGYAYTALRGARANRAGVILEIDRVRPTIIQVGGHGDSEGIMLSDGIAEPGWWGEVVAGKGISLMVLLSCDSGQQDQVNIADALLRVGVKAVISCDGKIGDADAVRFAELLYTKLSEELPLATATRRAKLAVSRKSAEMIRLREAI